MKSKQFVEKLKDIAQNYKTVYMRGTFGAPLTQSLITQKVKQYPNNYSAGRQSLLKGKIGDGLWAFDCVGLIKGILWGWRGDRSVSFGGAKYRANGVPDINADSMGKKCLEQSDDMAHILPGEAVCMKGHIGVYVGDGKVVESTLTGKYDGVAITDLSYRNWLFHGKLPWVEYEEEPVEEPETPPRTPQAGDIVRFSGGKHYVSSNGSLGYTAKAGPARVTRYLPGRKHPYHLVHIDKTSNVYGWVDENTVSF